MATEIEQAAIDREHLRLLAIFHYVIGGLYVLFSCFLLAYVFFFFSLASQIGFSPSSPSLHVSVPVAVQPPPAPLPAGNAPGFPGVVFQFVAGAFGLVALLVGVGGGLTIYSGACLARHRNKTLSYVMAAINCLSFPFGTILGIFTLVVLTRPSVERLYAGASTPASVPTP